VDEKVAKNEDSRFEIREMHLPFAVIAAFFRLRSVHFGIPSLVALGHASDLIFSPENIIFPSLSTRFWSFPIMSKHRGPHASRFEHLTSRQSSG
jgi:hypothetical protein